MLKFVTIYNNSSYSVTTLQPNHPNRSLESIYQFVQSSGVNTRWIDPRAAARSTTPILQIQKRFFHGRMDDFPFTDV
jgi:hypothetical protein